MAKINNPLIVLKGKDEQTKTVDLAMADGNQSITPDSGKTLSGVTVTKPATMLPANIKKDVNIGGVVGTLEEGIDISDTTATAADVRVGKDFYIADGTKTQGTIADYDGSFTGAGSRSNLNVHYSDTAPTDTSKLWIKSTEPENIEFIQDTEQQVQGLTTLSATLPTAASGIGTAAVGTKIYLFGGSGYLNTIQEFIVTFALTSGNILGQQDYNKNIFIIVQAPTKVTIGLKNVYKGNSSNVAEFVDAYLYDGTNWVNVNTGETA